ncbi:MAG: hypothetical protein ABI668_13070 [Sphingorhabdus sp.]
MPDLATIMTSIIALAAVASLLIQHRRTPKLPEPSITPTCLTIIGVEMRGTKSDLFGSTRNFHDER